MLSIISLFDDRARPKGSRDPLGLEAIWSFMGRKVVGNLTTVTSNLENFVVALLCCHHANSNWSKLEDVQVQFMRAEQLAAYLKLSYSNQSQLIGFLGITRAKNNFQDERISLGVHPDAQLLSDQLSYGLWGLYSSAMTGAGLISGSERKPTSIGKELIDDIIGVLGKDQWRKFSDIVTQNVFEKTAIKDISESFGAMLMSSELRQMVVNALISKQKHCELQSKLYVYANEYLEKSNDADDSTAQKFCNWLLENESADSSLKEAIEEINDIETLLVIANTVMSWMQGQKNQPVKNLQEILEKRLKGVQCKASKPQKSIPYHEFLNNLLSAINKPSASEVISILAKQNKDVMQSRGGAAWVEIDSQQQLKVRVPNDKADLPVHFVSHSQKWQNSYFMGSFLNIIKQGKSWKH